MSFQIIEFLKLISKYPDLKTYVENSNENNKRNVNVFFNYLIITMSKMFMYHRRPIYIYIIPDTTLSTVEEISSFFAGKQSFYKKNQADQLYDCTLVSF